MTETGLMGKPLYKKLEEDGLDQAPPPYVENQPAGGYPFVSPQYQFPHGPAPAGYHPGPASQPAQTIIITHAQPVKEPDYLAYSIFTMLCCCLPLGIAALVFSIQTQEANRSGNAISAQRNSRLARNLSHTALGVGIGFLILYTIFMFIIFNQKTYVLTMPTFSP